MSIDLAQRVHNHNWRLDPHVRSLLDTDFYKILMALYIWKNHPDVRVRFTMKNRSKARIRDHVGMCELDEQLRHVQGLRFTESELIWLAGNRFYGQADIFPGDFIQALRDLQLPDYRLTMNHKTGDYEITVEGRWFEVTFWEIAILAVVNEARARGAMKGMSHYQLKVLYANVTARLVGKLKSLREADVPRIAEFGTRRRHGFLWQDFVIEAMQEELGPNFLGTSNALHAMRRGLPAIGTNAHELPMVAAALARIEARAAGVDGAAALADSQFDVLRKWQETFSGNLLVALPDTFGTTQFLRRAPEAFPDIARWTGFREDSKDPFDGAEEKIAFWQALGEDPRGKLQLFSDGLDVGHMIDLHRAFGDRIRDGYGWGTLATNDFRGCDPRGISALDPISLVCKVSQVTSEHGTIGAVKLSDNYEKATGDAAEVAAYRAVFGTEGVADAPVIV
ncbi:nicotinate phosphoribosyltransferase [Cereibacter sphaeroides]|uniref:nicotinate phosphoribosyltransferase n=1 Tax=Cereibacter sphaeroides TaxID=1063 RepID=UPI001F157F2D|nr:nicotinate phosphoribosyltransferase [Cereibacter sphaeroides]MCE6957893.1 nicotinate phosphoribosyltransferase [Cereibacter sphaeroides]MCE6971759.1 nicotinate phosphoribosyltransferase [Cereibacter sphaeroides]